MWLTRLPWVAYYGGLACTAVGVGVGLALLHKLRCSYYTNWVAMASDVDRLNVEAEARQEGSVNRLSEADGVGVGRDDDSDSHPSRHYCIRRQTASPPFGPGTPDSVFGLVTPSFWKDYFAGMPLSLSGVLRVVSLGLVGVQIVADYKWTLRSSVIRRVRASAVASGTDPDAAVQLAWDRVHLRSAERITRALAERGGVFIKFGQYLSTLRLLLPEPWTDTLKSLLDHCFTRPLGELDAVFRRESRGLGLLDVFVHVDSEPLSSASLAQVHRGVVLFEPVTGVVIPGGAARRLLTVGHVQPWLGHVSSLGLPTQLAEADGLQPAELSWLDRLDPSKLVAAEVAIKVMHPGLLDNAVRDIQTIEIFVDLASALFPDTPFVWLSGPFRRSAPDELDFVREALNAERVRATLHGVGSIDACPAPSVRALLLDRALPSVAAVRGRDRGPSAAIILSDEAHHPAFSVPHTLWQLTSRRVHVMELVRGTTLTALADQQAGRLWSSSPAQHQLAEAVARIPDQFRVVFYTQIFTTRFLHCDPHMSNVMVRWPMPHESARSLLFRYFNWPMALFRHDFAPSARALALQDRSTLWSRITPVAARLYTRLSPATCLPSSLAKALRESPHPTFWDQALSDPLGQVDPGELGALPRLSGQTNTWQDMFRALRTTWVGVLRTLDPPSRPYAWLFARPPRTDRGPAPRHFLTDLSGQLRFSPSSPPVTAENYPQAKLLLSAALDRQSMVRLRLGDILCPLLYPEAAERAAALDSVVSGEPVELQSTARRGPRSHTDLELVLLDHGLYRPITPGFLHDYARLWLALLFFDTGQLKHSSARMGAPKLHRLLAPLLTQRVWAQLEGGGLLRTTDEASAADLVSSVERRVLQQGLRRFLPEVMLILHGIPQQFLLALKSIEALRMADRSMRALTLAQGFGQSKAGGDSVDCPETAAAPAHTLFMTDTRYSLLDLGISCAQVLRDERLELIALRMRQVKRQARCTRPPSLQDGRPHQHQQQQQAGVLERLVAAASRAMLWALDWLFLHGTHRILDARSVPDRHPLLKVSVPIELPGPDELYPLGRVDWSDPVHAALARRLCPGFLETPQEVLQGAAIGPIIYWENLLNRTDPESLHEFDELCWLVRSVAVSWAEYFSARTKLRLARVGLAIGPFLGSLAPRSPKTPNASGPTDTPQDKAQPQHHNAQMDQARQINRPPETNHNVDGILDNADRELQLDLGGA